MIATVTGDPILKRVRTSLETMYGPRIERIVLYGSRARGDAREDSDYDIAVFLRDIQDYWAESHRLADLGHDIMMEDDKFIDARPWPEGYWRQRTPLMHEIRKDGIDL